MAEAADPSSDYKAFQNKTVVDILDEVLMNILFRWKNGWWKIIRPVPGGAVRRNGF